MKDKQLDTEIANIISDDVSGTVISLDQMSVKIHDEKWYENMISDIDQAMFAVRSTLEVVKIKGYHSIGRYINLYRDEFDKMGVKDSDMTSRKIGKSLGISHTTICKAIKIAELFPKWEEVPINQVKSFNHLCQKYLTNSEQEKEKPEKRCPHCNNLI